MLSILMQDTVKYSLLGDSAAMEFFYINPSTGDIGLKKQLSDSTAQTFSVSVYV